MVSDTDEEERQGIVLGEDDTEEIARFVCSCGNVETFSESEFNHLRWLHHRFGYRNVSHAVGHQVQCCENPDYMETEGYHNECGW